MTAASTEIATATSTTGAGTLRSRRRGAGWLGFTPFAIYVLLFLAVPTVYAVASGFFTDAGTFTFANLAAFANPTIIGDFVNSFWVSAVVALVGAVVGAVLCWALLGAKPTGTLRTVVDSASSVLAQFGGIMLAFAFIALMGLQGVMTLFLKQTFGFDINSHGPLLYQVGGLVFPYLYFSIPLMVITFMPAMEGLKQQWGEAAATLGASRFTYWWRVAFPILAPAFWGSTILLFANAFSSFATAAALIDQGGIVPLAIKQQLTSETIVGVSNTAGVLALGMIVVMVVVMAAYSALQRRARRWER
ncbi:ABC transporter permease subunit [Planctomonas sp. JC2975]|uniref:ABC transporter permease n=1 Tax=Planctomonas sp. JC2975 TaxID=2729626 RepID=UPI00147540EF|nr:ABC transporter permease subunit [Planctomonas sp. JC2975]NNC10362.1 ABC transporter permease subunit [Planctomonas sp. JC2975]